MTIKQLRVLQNRLFNNLAISKPVWLGVAALISIAFTVQEVRAQEGGRLNRDSLHYSVRFQNGVMTSMSFTGSVHLGADELFDYLIFLEDRTPDRAEERLVTDLSLEIYAIDQRCKLTKRQKQQLLMVGRGDIKRFFDKYDSMSADPRIIAQFETFHTNRRAHALARGELSDLLRVTAPLRAILQGSLFHSNSLLERSITNVLTDHQVVQYQGLQRERVERIQEEAFANLIRILEEGDPVSAPQRQALANIVHNDIKPAGRDGPYGTYCLLLQLARLSGNKAEGILTDGQRQTLARTMNHVNLWESILHEAGYIARADDRDDN